MHIIPFRRKEVFGDLENIQNEVNRLFNFSLARWQDQDKGLFETLGDPGVDILESKDDIVVLADIPGVAKEDISVSVHGDTLQIKGEKKQAPMEKDRHSIRAERYYGSFSKTITLPAEIETPAVQATYKDGVLSLKLPKKETAKPRQIQIQVQ